MSFTSLRRFPFLRLLLAGAVALLWYRSHHATDVLTLFLHRGTAQVFASDRGRAVLLFSNLSLGSERAYTYDYLTAPNAEFDEVRENLYGSIPAPERLAGVWLAAGPHTGSELLSTPSAKYRIDLHPLLADRDPRRPAAAPGPAHLLAPAAVGERGALPRLRLRHALQLRSVPGVRASTPRAPHAAPRAHRPPTARARDLSKVIDRLPSSVPRT